MNRNDQPIWIRKNRLAELAPVMEQAVEDRETPAPWQVPPTMGNRRLFPRTHTADDLQFFLVLGALNFSYWKTSEQGLTTWGISPKRGEWIHDVFALCWCLRGRGSAELSAESLVDLHPERVRDWFRNPVSRRVEIPMLSARLRKLRELGRGLIEFSDETGEPPVFYRMLERVDTVPDLLENLAHRFPYSFGDPLRKLSQLLVKMLIDRRSDRSPGDDLEPSKTYDRLLDLDGVDELQAQPDYMLPLFFLKTGLWGVKEPVSEYFDRGVPLPWGHPVEEHIRQLTVKSVRLLADELERPTGWVRCRIDSVVWSTAVTGCFPVDCEGCTFHRMCDAVQGRNDRLSWDHHRTRTPYY